VDTSNLTVKHRKISVM